MCEIITGRAIRIFCLAIRHCKGSGSGGGAPVSLGRGNIGGGVTGATGVGESVQVSEGAHGSGSGGAPAGVAAARADPGWPPRP